MRIGGNSDEYYDWTSLPAAYGVNALLNTVAMYDLDQLYAPRDNASLPAYKVREKIRGKITEAIRQPLKEHGINLIVAGVIAITPSDKKVTEQRVESWSADWQQLVEIERAKLDAQIRIEMGRVQAQAERRIVENFSKELSKIAEEYQADLKVLRLIAAVLNMTKEVKGPLGTDSRSDEDSKD
jgi:hypothetical protein